MLAHLMRTMESVHDDAGIERALRAGAARDAMNGSPVSRHWYRLECGHMIDVFGAPLPETKRRAFCGNDACRKERNVVEHLT